MANFLIPPEILIPIIALIIILLVVLWLLYLKNKKFSKEIVGEKIKYKMYQNQIKFLKNSKKTPQEDFNHLNDVVRSFFTEYYGMKTSKSYAELAQEFNSENKIQHGRFCQSISNLKYSGSITRDDVNKLIKFFELLIKTE